MNKYAIIAFFKRKNIWEILVVTFGSLLALLTIFYSNMLAQIIAEREHSQVKLWANSIQERAKLLELSNEIFTKLSEEERKKVKLNAEATKLMISETDNQKLTFFLDFIKFNENIPIVSTDEKGRILAYRNINNPNIQKDLILDSTKNPDFFKYPPIEINFEQSKNYIYFKESIIFQQLIEYLNTSGQAFLKEIGKNISSLPVLVLDTQDSIIQYGNIDEHTIKDKKNINAFIKDFKSYNPPINVNLNQNYMISIYFKNSNIITYLKWFPFFLYGSIAILIFITYSALKNARRIEKNQIWVGMSKETAHQLGTPISSLGAWLEVLKEHQSENKAPEEKIVSEMEKDVNRLSLIADRFSKIGSKPKLIPVNLSQILTQSVEYIKHRAPKKTNFDLQILHPDAEILVNVQLFEWVVENLIRNALDALHQDGKISIHSFELHDKTIIDFKDNGKGITSDFKEIFEPGFTTKKRGWGLGLSLCKRIVEDYFGGKIYVKWSKPNQGTLFRIELKKYIHL